MQLHRKRNRIDRLIVLSAPIANSLIPTFRVWYLGSSNTLSIFIARARPYVRVAMGFFASHPVTAFEYVDSEMALEVSMYMGMTNIDCLFAIEE